MADSRRGLTAVDRATIELRLLDGWGIRAIARALDRSSGAISDEINRHRDDAGYQAHRAEAQSAASRCLSGRKPRPASDGALFGEIAGRFGWGGRLSGHPAGANALRRVWSSDLAGVCRTRRSTRRFMPCRAASCAAN